MQIFSFPSYASDFLSVQHLCPAKTWAMQAFSTASTWSWSAVKLVRALFAGFGWFTSCSVSSAPSTLIPLPEASKGKHHCLLNIQNNVICNSDCSAVTAFDQLNFSFKKAICRSAYVWRHYPLQPKSLPSGEGSSTVLYRVDTLLLSFP